MLLEQQSTEELQTKLKDENMHVVFTVSLQSVMALAKHYGIDPEKVRARRNERHGPCNSDVRSMERRTDEVPKLCETKQTFRRIAGVLKSMGAKEVYDTCFSKDLSLIEIADEFVTRYKERGCMPMLASACPGWICYAEKTLGNFALPYISTTKSPQQIAGTVVKNFLCNKKSLDPRKVYHCTIMPCYDKKLEASREDFVTGKAEHSYCEVDCVITTGEIAEFFETRGISIADSVEGTVDDMTGLDQEERGAFFSTPGGSGGFVEHVFREAALSLFGKMVEGPLQMRILRNQDFREVTLEINGEKVLNFATVYGFRNIQNLVRKLKMGKSPYHFVEIMACPGGCVNGGGQLPPKEGQSAKELIAELETMYNASIQYRHPQENKKVELLYAEWLTSPHQRQRMLHTGYHARENTIGIQVNNW